MNSLDEQSWNNETDSDNDYSVNWDILLNDTYEEAKTRLAGQTDEQKFLHKHLKLPIFKTNWTSTENVGEPKRDIVPKCLARNVFQYSMKKQPIRFGRSIGYVEPVNPMYGNMGSDNCCINGSCYNTDSNVCACSLTAMGRSLISMTSDHSINENDVKQQIIDHCFSLKNLYQESEITKTLNIEHIAKLIPQLFYPKPRFNSPFDRNICSKSKIFDVIELSDRYGISGNECLTKYVLNIILSSSGSSVHYCKRVMRFNAHLLCLKSTIDTFNTLIQTFVIYTNFRYVRGEEKHALLCALKSDIDESIVEIVQFVNILVDHIHINLRYHQDEVYIDITQIPSLFSIE